MDSLLFLIKKHNNNKTADYNDKLAYIIYYQKNTMRHDIHHMQYYIRIIKLQKV